MIRSLSTSAIRLPRLRRGNRLQAVPPAWPLILIALVGVANLVLLVVQAHALVHALYLNADHASSVVLPALAGHATPGSAVNLGDHRWYEPWWFMRVTSGFPYHRQLWELAPFAVAFLGIGSVAACAYQALGRSAAVVCFVALISASAVMRGILYVPEDHVSIVIHSGVLCGTLLFGHRRLQSRDVSLRTLLLVGIPLVVFTGAGLTDPMLIVSGLIPFVLAPAWCWRRYKTRAWRSLTIFAAAVGALSLLVMALLNAAMHSEHIVAAPFPIDFVSMAQMTGGARNLVAALTSLGGGDFFGLPLAGSTLPVFIAGTLALIAFAAVLRWMWQWSISAPTGVSDQRPTAHRDLFVAYWGTALAVVLCVFVLTTLGENEADGRYLLGAWIAAPGLLGALATTKLRRGAVLLGVLLFAAIALRTNIDQGAPSYGPGPDLQTAGAIEHFTESEGARTGYASYWDAAPVTWETHLQLKLYPIGPCGTTGELGRSPSGWCSFYNNQISSWYVPVPDRRTFLLTDARVEVPLAIAAPPAAFGHPIASATFGVFTVYVYGHDIARDLRA